MDEQEFQRLQLAAIEALVKLSTDYYAERWDADLAGILAEDVRQVGLDAVEE